MTAVRIGVAVQHVSHYDPGPEAGKAVDAMTGGLLEGQETQSLRQLSELVRMESSDGARLVSNLSDNPICRVMLDAVLPCVTLVWGRYATSAQLRFVHECVLELLRREGWRKVLGDDTALAMIPVDDQVWILEDWMPRAIVAGLEAAASKRPHGFFGKQSVANVQSAAPPGVSLRSFESLTEARAWLMQI